MNFIKNKFGMKIIHILRIYILIDEEKIWINEIFLMSPKVSYLNEWH